MSSVQSTGADEDELQAILEAAPDRPAPPHRGEECVFCERVADRWTNPDEVGLFVPEDVPDDSPVPICSDCYRSETSGCMYCIIGSICPEHQEGDTCGEEELITVEELEGILSSLRHIWSS